MRGATGYIAAIAPRSKFQSTLLMRGATKIINNFTISKKFQSTLLMRGATRDIDPASYQPEQFQSTLLMRGATRRRSRSARSCSHFNPRSSCEERRWRYHVYMAADKFQSTLLMRGATRLARQSCNIAVFQSTLLMRGATGAADRAPKAGDFNPRSSCEERLQLFTVINQLICISIHAPHARSDHTDRLLCFP